jgi:CPA2 family monovalent cation:H+ antiporter-2
VLAVALGVAFGAAMLFGVSFALGAFFAGMILAESPLSQRAAQETLPLRDAFAVLFFVSVGMLFNPETITDAPLPLLGTVGIILIGKSVAAFAIVRIFGRTRRTALTIAVSLAQIGEFSFILATLGTSLDMLPPAGRDLILAGAIISIMLNPLLFSLIDRHVASADPETTSAPLSPAPPPRGHIVLVGHGRVGRLVADALLAANEKLTVIEAQRDKPGLPGDPAVVLAGDPASGRLLREARIADARLLFVAIPDSFEAGQIVEQARRLNPGLRIVARAHGEAEAAHLESHGADRAIISEREIARRMIDEALDR